MAESLQTKLNQARQRSLVVAGVFGVLALIGLAVDAKAFYPAYLMGFLFVAGISLGSLALVMIHHLTGGRWGFGLRRILEASTRTLPLVAVLFIPIILPWGMDTLYHQWRHPAEGDQIIALKAGYLNYGAFVFRGILCFGIWGFLAFLMNHWSARQDETGDVVLNRPLRMWSGPGIVLYFLAATVAAWDWGMSLDPHWFSSMYGPLFMICQGLTTFGFSIVVVTKLAQYKPLSEVMTRKVFHDIGNLTFAFGILWAYMSVAQYIIIWSGNLPEEIPYYLNRTGNGWQVIAVMLALFHFAVPFLLLLMRHNKVNSRNLIRIAYWILAMRFVDLYWTIFPTFYPTALDLNWIHIVVPAAMVALFVWYFLGQLRSRPLLPLHDPRFEVSPVSAMEAVSHV